MQYKPRIHPLGIGVLRPGGRFHRIYQQPTHVKFTKTIQKKDQKYIPTFSIE